MKACNKHIIRTLELTVEMIDLADRGDADREDASCGVLYGILRDSACELRKLAGKEKEAHNQKGIWMTE